MSGQNRIFGLDLYRSLAIILVVAGHGQSIMPFFQLIRAGGFYGVELFYVLSGFLIGSILIKLFSDSNSYDLKCVTTFWIRRWFRTIPNYLLFLTLNIVVWGSTVFVLPYFFFLQNFAWPCPSFMGESWSLAVEEWFYISIPLWFYVIGRALRGKIAHKNMLLSAVVLYILVITILRFCVAINRTDRASQNGIIFTGRLFS